jgi:hypothetical protein
MSRLNRLHNVSVALKGLSNGDPHPAEEESFEGASRVYTSTMTRYSALHESMPKRSGSHALSDREVDAFEGSVKEAEAALANALRAAEKQVATFDLYTTAFIRS